MTAVHVATVTPHPMYPALSLVVWVLADGATSFDALSIDQEVGQPTGRPKSSALTWALMAGIRSVHPDRSPE
jgi:hypothetical protein